MQAKFFSGGGDHPKGFKESSAVEEDWQRQRGPHKRLSECTLIVGLHRKILSGVSRLGCTKVKTVEVGVVLSSLERTHQSIGSRMLGSDLGPTPRKGVVLGWR